ncbi:MAG: MBOAT family protein, partial [Clostridia bacterium]|nr:MBOAT family protein [Clostridia bacterium]
MVFSSNAFLFFFLPIVLGFYYLFRKNRTAANTILTVFSLLFYAWGEPAFVLIMLASIFMNWLFALGIDRYRAGKCAAKAIVVVSCVMNIGLLGVFKYTSFVVTNLNKAFSLSIPDPGLALPIGISFFTFQAMSYVIDVYRQKGEVQKNFMGVCLYISFFPQLIAGPIVRYQTVADEIKNRKETVEDFCAGVRRFLVGFAKKAILANNMAIVVDKVFACSQSEMSVALMWYAAIAYLIQVYYDFSGYSDMAIGLGRMFGFHFLENFNYPFLSKSVAEFWRRWHISLTSWFRDYVFFPLGGSRVKTGRLIFNMFVVWS